MATYRQIEWLEVLAVERSNLRAALDWSIVHHGGVTTLRLANGLDQYFNIRPQVGEGRQWFADALGGWRTGGIPRAGASDVGPGIGDVPRPGPCARARAGGGRAGDGASRGATGRPPRGR